MSSVASSALAAPYRGLAPFGETELDALMFFGRERETEIVVANLLASRLTILYGPSGVGKSSLLRAGMARRIRELAGRRAIGRGPDGAVVVVSAWADDPVTSIAEAVATEVTSIVRRRVPPPEGGASLANVIAHWSTVLDGDLYLVLDQLEEYFVYHEDALGPGTLAGELSEIVLRPRLRANVLLSLRDDALAQLDVFKRSIPNLFANYLRLDRLDHAAATAAILGPLQRWNDLVPSRQRVGVEPELVDDVLVQAAVAGEPGRIEPPYLQLVMERLWHEERERGSALLRASTLAELGGAGAIVREHLDRSLSVLDDDDRDAAARMFEHLVTPSGTKVAHRVSDLAEFGQVPVARAGTMLATLGRERILRPLDEGSGAGGRYEIFHDVLAEAILGWRGRHGLERERAAARRRQRTLAAVAAGALIALVVISAVAILALSERSAARRQANHAQGRELGARALLEQSKDPEQSLALALEGARLDPTAQSEEVLRSSLLAARLRAALPVHASVTAVAFDPRGGRIAVGALNGDVLLWSPRGHSHRTLLRGPPVSTLAFDRQGFRLLVVGGGSAVELNPTSGRRVVSFGYHGVHSAVFAESGRVVATAADDGIRLWRAADGRLVRRIPGSRFDDDVIVSPDGRSLAAISGDGHHHLSPSLYDTRSGRLRGHLSQRGATAEVFSPDSTLLATSSADGTTIIWRVRDGKQLRVLDDGGGDIRGLAFSPDGSLLATASDDGGVRVWHVQAGDRFFFFIGHQSPVAHVTFDPSGTYLVSSSVDGIARIWATTGIGAGHSVALLAGHSGPTSSSAYAPDGKTLVTGGDDGKARLWDTRIERYPRTVVTERAQVDAASFVSAGRLVVDVAGGTVRVRAGRRVVGSRRSGAVLALSTTGLVATATGNTILVSHAPSLAMVSSVQAPGRVVALAFRSDAKELAAVAGRTLIVWNLGRKRIVHEFRVPSGTTRVAIAPAGDVLLTGGRDGGVRLFTAGGALLHVLHGHLRAITAAGFDPSGRHVVTASEGTARNVVEWDVRTGVEIDELVVHFGTVSAASFSSDGRWILTAGPAAAGVWPSGTGRLLFLLRGTGALLTDARWSLDGFRIVTSWRDGTVRTYGCGVCAPLPSLVALAQRRVKAAG